MRIMRELFETESRPGACSLGSRFHVGFHFVQTLTDGGRAPFKRAERYDARLRPRPERQTRNHFLRRGRGREGSEVHFDEVLVRGGHDGDLIWCGSAATVPPQVNFRSMASREKNRTGTNSARTERR